MRSQFSTTTLHRGLRYATLTLMLLAALTHLAQAQTYSVIYNFTGGQDGATPLAGVSLDRAGNLYGTTSGGGFTGGRCSGPGLHGCGTVYDLKHTNSTWLFNPLYTFQGQYSDGAAPHDRVVFGPNGSLYGTTAFGGPADEDCAGLGCGTVFNLRPSAVACKTALCPWTENVLFFFNASLGQGGNPLYGDVVFDPAGNIYGTLFDRIPSFGMVFGLIPSNGNWSLDYVYPFPADGNEGDSPTSSVIFDPAGDLYGTTSRGGPPGGYTGGYGIIYELTPSGSGWAEQILYLFQNGSDGAYAEGGAIRDQAGNLYGTTQEGGAGGGGTVWELSPSGGGWTLTTLYSFTGALGSFASLTMDAAGNLYGTTNLDGAHGQGNIFKLTNSGGNWSYTSLHDFTGGSDGGKPYGQVTLDANGNIYGTAANGGATGNGVVWKITP